MAQTRFQEALAAALHPLDPLLLRYAEQRQRAIYGDVLKISGEVLAYNPHLLRKYGFPAKNKILSQGLRGMIMAVVSAINYTSVATGYMLYGSPEFNSGVTKARLRLGSDTGTATIESMTTLTAEIAVDRSSANVTISRVGTGQYRVAWVATWNAGTISGTVGEMGLFLAIPRNVATAIPLADADLPLTNPNFLPPQDQTQGWLRLFSRLSSASLDFSSFVINTANPLTIEWRLNLNF